MSDKVFVCKTSFATEYEGAPLVVSKGQRIREGHELIDANPDAFELADEGQILEVETATKAPGKKRGTANGDKVSDGPTNDELKAELKKLGVDVPKRANKKKLTALLEEAQKKADEGQTGEPDEGQEPEPEGDTSEQETETPGAEGSQGEGDPAEGDNTEA